MEQPDVLKMMDTMEVIKNYPKLEDFRKSISKKIRRFNKGIMESFERYETLDLVTKNIISESLKTIWRRGIKVEKFEMDKGKTNSFNMKLYVKNLKYKEKWFDLYISGRLINFVLLSI